MKTKNCRYCKEDIDAGATKCPQCQSDLRSWPAKHPIISIFIALIFLGGMSSALTGSSGSSSMTTPTPTPAIDKEKMATLFCSKRSDGAPYFDLKAFVEGKTIYNTTRKPASDDCKKTVDICLAKWSVEACENIADKKMWIGMEELQLLLSQRNPRDKNNTTNAYGIHSQWVYGDFGPYVYLEGKDEDSLKVTSWQD